MCARVCVKEKNACFFIEESISRSLGVLKKRAVDADRHGFHSVNGLATKIWIGTFPARVSLPTGSASYADTGLIEGTQYSYRVIAFNTAGDSAPSSSAGTTASQSPASGSSGGSSGGSGGCSATFGGSGLMAMASLLFFTLTLKRRKLS